jgi:hypothetical protein
MEFEDRLQRAIERGRRQGASEARAAAEAAMNEEQARRLHTQYRLDLSEHIEKCLRRLPDHFPGFRVENVTSDRGWGAAVSRDDVAPTDGSRTTVFSRLEIVIRPYSQVRVIELVAKGTIRNKEVFSRNQFQRLTDIDAQVLKDAIDQWVVDYAELYAAKGSASRG